MPEGRGGSETTLTVSVKNPSDMPRTDQPVVIPLQNYGYVASALVTHTTEIPCQLDDLDQDDDFDELCFLADLAPNETKTYTVTLSSEGEPRPYPARVYAEMVMGNKNVKEKNKQNNFIESITARGDCAYSYNLQHHHGVDFESELNGIRIYFDQRQTLDLYGKFKKRLELQDTQFYTSEEQKAQGYGDDVLWVGNTFGLGAFRGWDGQQPTMIDPVRSRTQRVISYGPLRTIVEVIDRGWQLPQHSTLNSQPSSLNPQHSSLNTKLSSLNTQLSTLNTQLSTLNTQLSTLNTQLSTLNTQINMTLRYTQYAGHRDTDVDVFFNRDASQYRFSTGIINVKGSVEFSDHRGLRACWGTDYPSTDTLKWKRETVGLAVLIPQQHIVSEEPANKDNYAFVVAPQKTPTDDLQSPVTQHQSSMSYKIAYCSDNETFGYHSSNDWFDWLKLWRKEVDTPVIIEIKE